MKATAMQNGIYKVSDGESVIYHPSLLRATRYFNLKIKDQIQNVLNRYYPLENKENLFRQALVLDVGANVGEFSLAVAKYADFVVAVEPEPKTFSCL